MTTTTRVDERPHHRTVGDLLAEQATRFPDRPFIQMVGGSPCTYAQAYARARQIATGLGSAGLQSGQAAVLMLANSLDHIFTSYAVNLLGGIEVSINTGYRGAALEHAIRQCGAKLIVVEAQFLPLVHAALPAVPALETVVVVGTAMDGGDWGRVRLLEFDELCRNDGDLELPQVRHSDVASIIYTSGTTGPAKGVLMPHAQVVLLARRTAEQCRLGPDDVVYCYLPMFHMAGKFMSVLGTMSAGGKVVLDDRFSADKWLERIRDCGATFTGGHGPMLEMIHALPATADDRNHSLRTVCSAPFPKQIAGSFQERFGVRGLEVWGMTEVGIPCWSSLDEPLHDGSCGRVDDEWFEFRIVDPATDEPLPTGETGEFVVRACHPFTLMQGYIGMPEKTVEAWRNMWFHTGDVGYVDASGLVYFVDRGSERIRRRAENISPYDIEVAALKHPAVAEAAAVGVPSGLAGDDDVKLCVVLRHGVALEAVDLLRHLAAELSHFMVPRYLEFVEALPRSATHKVQRAALKRPPFGADVWDRKQHGVALRDLVNGMSASPNSGAAGDN